MKLLCLHRWAFVRCITIGASRYSIWYCPRCGKVRCQRDRWREARL